MLVAGAGSGKTSVMAARVIYLAMVATGAWPADHPGVLPGNVLCLTFTNKATENLILKIRRALATLDLDEGEDGFFVLNTQGPYDSAANDDDFVNGSASTQSLVVFGGRGNDDITGGRNDDILFGDRGRVVYFDREITAEEAVSLTDAQLEALGVAVFGHGGPGDKTDGVVRKLGLVFSVDPSVGGVDKVRGLEGRDIVFGGAAGDELTAGASDAASDVILGDNGRARFVEDVLVDIASINPEIGGDDTITAGSGANYIIGGKGEDTIVAGGDDAADVIVGDNGRAQFAPGTGIVLSIESIAAQHGNDDTITAGNGPNTIIGGSGDDSITAGNGAAADVIIGDNGKALFEGGKLVRIETTDFSYGGDDTIFAGNGPDTVLGGAGNDIIDAGTDSSRDIVLGDNGFGLFDLVMVGGELRSVLRLISSTETHLGGQDQIVVGDGDDVVIGGKDTDYINFTRPAPGGTPQRIGVDFGADVMVGDSGSALFDTTTGISLVVRIETMDALNGDDDFIFAGNGPDTVLGGSGADLIVAGGDDAGSDIVLGDNGWATFTTLRAVIEITSTDPQQGGNDIITTGDGPDVVLGGSGSDIILAAADDDAASEFLGLVGTAFAIDPALVVLLIGTGAGDMARDVVLG
ncbi:MAG TPA: UvrD-helicase domain-containing protein, partial [Candidatus Limnocylindrales bacterium]